ncbi:MAG: EFR1 family ferrodoxin [Treponema sp.]|jgi:ferredoxin|nr:EFR1 family ferrodoxin [Treponema sp.]
MAKNIIFYFSGTGNALKLARDIAGDAGDTDIVFMGEGSGLTQNYEQVGFVFPCYAGGAPKIVLQFLRKLDTSALSPSVYFFTVVSCNAWGGNSAHMVHAVLKRKGGFLSYANVVPTVGNYIPKYPPEKSFVDNSLELTLKEADKKAQIIAAAIRDKARLEPDKWSLGKAIFYRVGNLYFGIMAKKLAVSGKCVNCGICVRLCPVGNIRQGKDRPEFRNKDCTQCMACLQWCPQKAIQCSKGTASRNRYHNPAVTLQDLLRDRGQLHIIEGTAP